jgi:hypothetical protein
MRRITKAAAIAAAALAALTGTAAGASAGSSTSDIHTVTVRADYDGAVALPSLNRNFPTMTLDVNGAAQWGATPDGYEGGFIGDGRDGTMTTTYTHNVAFHNRLWTIGQSGAQGSGTPADWWYRGPDKTTGPSQTGALLFRVNGGAWQEFTPADATFRLPSGASSMSVEVAFNDHAGWYAPNTISPAGLDEGNTGSYAVTATRTKAG